MRKLTASEHRLLRMIREQHHLEKGVPCDTYAVWPPDKTNPILVRIPPAGYYRVGKIVRLTGDFPGWAISWYRLNMHDELVHVERQRYPNTKEGAEAMMAEVQVYIDIHRARHKKWLAQQPGVQCEMNIPVP